MCKLSFPVLCVFCCVPSDGCSHEMKLGLFKSRGKFIFYGALLLVKSLFWTSRHAFSLLMGALILVKSLLWISRHIYFLQCSPFGEVVVVDLEARVFVSLMVGALI